MTQATVMAAAMQGWDGLIAANSLARIDNDGRLPALRSHDPHRAAGPAALPPTGTMALAEFVRFSEAVVNETSNVTIPWLAGLHYDLGELGSVGEVVNSADRVGTAIRRLVDHFSLLQDATDIRLECDERMACVSYRILDPEIWPRHHDAMFSLGIIAQIIRRGTGGGWEKIEFAFEAEQFEMRGDVGGVVRAPCSFGADTNMIRFPNGMLNLALPTPAPQNAVRRMSRELVERRRAIPIIDRLSHVFFRDLNALAIDQERVAREIGMSSRTMRRKLADAGSSYQRVLDDCRMRQAAFEFRARPELSIAQIALRLGYAEHSNFTRAFRRWSGVSPQAFRNDPSAGHRAGAGHGRASQ